MSVNKNEKHLTKDVLVDGFVVTNQRALTIPDQIPDTESER
jgi:hypothetical protein